MPSVVVPSLKSTVPVAPGGATVAVKVTDCSEVEGLVEETRVTEATARFTVCVIGAEVETAWLSSPS